MLSRILVPLDGSLEAEQAIPAAAQLARSRMGTIILAHIAPAETSADGGEGLTERALVRRQPEPDIYARANAATSYLAHVVATQPTLKALQVETSAHVGPMPDLILAVAESTRADLIVISGRHAHWVSAAANVPVLVVRGDQVLRAPSGQDQRPPLRAVVGLDGSPQAEVQVGLAARVVRALAAPDLGALHLVHVVRPGENEADAKAYLSAVAHDLRRQMLDDHVLLTWSITWAEDPAGALIEMSCRPRQRAGLASSIDAIYGPGRTGEIDAEAFDGADLVVVIDQDAYVPRWQASSGTLDRVLAQTMCPVLVVRESGARDDVQPLDKSADTSAGAETGDLSQPV